MSAIEFTPEQLELAGDDSRGGKRRLPADTLARTIASRHGLTVTEMLGPSRLRHVVVARAELYRALRAQGWSYPAIGRFAGHRDHTTIMAAIGAGSSAASRRARLRPVVPKPKPRVCSGCRRPEAEHVRLALGGGLYSSPACPGNACGRWDPAGKLRRESASGVAPALAELRAKKLERLGR